MALRITLLRWHILLASFFLPWLLLYMLSGLLYTFGVKGSISKQEFIQTIDRQTAMGQEEIESLVFTVLQEASLVLPDSQPSVKENFYKWSERTFFVKAHIKGNGRELKIIYGKRNLLAQIMRMHRGEAGKVMKAMALLFVTALLLVYLSGIYLAYTVSRYRPTMVTAGVLGTIMFFLLWFLL